MVRPLLANSEAGNGAKSGAHSSTIGWENGHHSAQMSLTIGELGADALGLSNLSNSLCGKRRVTLRRVPYQPLTPLGL